MSAPRDELWDRVLSGFLGGVLIGILCPLLYVVPLAKADGPTVLVAKTNSDSDTAQNDGTYFKTGKWLAFPLSLLCGGAGGVFFGVYFAYIHRCEWWVALGLLSIAAGLCIFIYGLNRVFEHIFITVPPVSEWIRSTLNATI
jgi:hypothetical protein